MPRETDAFGVTVQTVEALHEIEALRREWHDLWLRSKTTPFQSPAWLISWYRHLRFGTPWVIAVRSAERLIGILPLVVSGRDTEATRRCYLAGTGVTDYLDAIVESGREEEALAAFGTALTENSERWDVCDLQQLRSTSVLAEAAETAEFFSRTELELQGYCPALIRKEGEWPIPRAFLQKLQYEERRLHRSGEFAFKTAQTDTFELFFEQFLRLHGARWQTRGETGVLTDASVQRFHEDAAARLLGQGVLRLHVLFEQKRPVAAFYGFVHRQRAFYYLAGFDPEYQRLSVGNQIVWHALQEAEREGVQAFDFLRGQEPYKYRWGAVDQPAFRRQLYRSNVVW